MSKKFSSIAAVAALMLLCTATGCANGAVADNGTAQAAPQIVQLGNSENEPTASNPEPAEPEHPLPNAVANGTSPLVEMPSWYFDNAEEFAEWYEATLDGETTWYSGDSENGYYEYQISTNGVITRTALGEHSYSHPDDEAYYVGHINVFPSDRTVDSAYSTQSHHYSTLELTNPTSSDVPTAIRWWKKGEVEAAYFIQTPSAGGKLKLFPMPECYLLDRNKAVYVWLDTGELISAEPEESSVIATLGDSVYGGCGTRAGKWLYVDSEHNLMQLEIDAYDDVISANAEILVGDVESFNFPLYEKTDGTVGILYNGDGNSFGILFDRDLDKTFEFDNKTIDEVKAMASEIAATSAKQFENCGDSLSDEQAYSWRLQLANEAAMKYGLPAKLALAMQFDLDDTSGSDYAPNWLRFEDLSIVPEGTAD